MKSNLLLMASLLACNEAMAQETQEKVSFSNLYMNAEYGKTKGYQHLVQGGVYLQLDQYYFKIKAVSAFDTNTAAEKKLYTDYYYDSDRAQENVGFQDISFMAGMNFRTLKHHQIQLGTGLSALVKTDKNEEFNRQKQAYQPDRFKKRFTVGLPAEVRYTFQFGRGVALSCTGTANANFLKSYAAVSAGVAVGMF